MNTNYSHQRISGLLFLCFLLPWPALAQGPVKSDEEIQAHFAETRSRQLGEGALDSQALGEESEVVIEAGEEKQVAKLKLTWTPRDTRLGFTLSSPIGDNENRVDFATFDGLADTLNAELAFTWINWPSDWQRQLSVRDLHEAKLRLCRELFSLDTIRTARTPDFEDLEAYLKAGREAKNPDELKKNHNDSAQLEADCSEETLVQAWSSGNTGPLLAWKKLTQMKKPVLMLGLRAKAGRKQFEFADSADQEARKKNRNASSGTGAIGLLIPRLQNRHSVLWLSASFEQAHKAQDARTLCSPTSGTAGLLDCESKVIGEPNEVDSEVYQLEYRQFFRRVAVSPRIFYRTDESVTGIDVPLYFLRGEKKERNFTGGVRVSWRDDTEDVSAAIFIGSALPALDGIFAD